MMAGRKPKKPPREDFNQAAFRIVQQATKERNTSQKARKPRR